jgi:transaldolase
MLPTTIDDVTEGVAEKAAALVIDDSKIVTMRICNATEGIVFKAVALKRLANDSNVQIRVGSTIHANRPDQN